MADASLPRIPFRASDEQMILQMARWMHFIGVVTVTISLVMFFLTVVAGFVGAAALRTDEPSLGRLARVIEANPAPLVALLAFALISSLLSSYAGFALLRGAHDFDKTARTDVADQDFVADGLACLRSYFKIQVVLGVTSVLVAISAAASFVARPPVS